MIVINKILFDLKWELTTACAWATSGINRTKRLYPTDQETITMVKLNGHTPRISAQRRQVAELYYLVKKFSFLRSRTP